MMNMADSRVLITFIIVWFWFNLLALFRYVNMQYILNRSQTRRVQIEEIEKYMGRTKQLCYKLGPDGYRSLFGIVACVHTIIDVTGIMLTVAYADLTQVGLYIAGTGIVLSAVSLFWTAKEGNMMVDLIVADNDSETIYNKLKTAKSEFVITMRNWALFISTYLSFVALFHIFKVNS